MSEAAVKKYVVRLSAEERQTLEALISKGKHPAAQVLKARILLKADVSEAGEGWSDSRIVKALDVSPATIYRTRQRLVEEGFEAVLARKHSPNSARPRIFDGAAEAKLIALMCLPPPKGRAKWTLRLLEDTVGTEHRCARQRQHDRTHAKKNDLKPHLKKQYVIPPEANAAFVANMEDVLDVYHGPRDPECPSSAWTRPRSS